jgi:endonuclease YncB( thermonuclease family)
MKKYRKNQWTSSKLLSRGVPAVLIPGLLVALALGWNGGALTQIQNWQEAKAVFPSQGIVQTIEDGDTFTLQNGRSVRLLGVNAPERGSSTYVAAQQTLANLLNNKQVYLEYDRYQDDKYGRILAWVWVNCEKAPDFLPANYMHYSGNASRPSLMENPKGCRDGKLVNEEMVRARMAVPIVYADRGKLKYEKRIMQ